MKENIEFAMACLIVISMCVMGCYMSKMAWRSFYQKGSHHMVYRNHNNSDEYILKNLANCKVEIVDIDFKELEWRLK